MHSRLNAGRWRHDAYTLRGLQAALQSAVDEIQSAGTPALGRVVDMGAGAAPYRSLFETLGGAYVACDIGAGPGIDVIINDDGTTSLEASAADCVVSFQVLEHVWDVAGYLNECKRLLRPEGRLLLSTHGTWLYHPHPGDYRRWTRDGLCKELNKSGFDVVAVKPVVGPLAWTTQFRAIAYHHVLERFGAIGRLASIPLGYSFYLRMLLEDRMTPRALTETNAAVYVVIAKLGIGA